MALTRTLLERAFEAAGHPAARGAARRARFDYETCVVAGRRVTALDDSVACSILDLDDVHWPTGTHPGSMVWPAALAGGHDPELAAIVGYEVMIRAARAFGPGHRSHWHPSSTAGVLGAAAAAAVSTGCSREDALVCLSHATSLATGLGQGVVEEVDAPVVHRLHARRTAQLCLESVGLAPPEQGFEGERGLFAAFGGDAAPLLEPLTTPAIAEVSFRLYPVSGLLQGLAAAAGSIAPAADDDPVEVVVAPAVAGIVDRPRPRTPRDRWWSAQWTAAAYLLGVDPRAAGETSRVEALASHVAVLAGPQPSLTVGSRSVAVEERRQPLTGDLLSKWRMLNPEREPPRELPA